MKLWSSGRSGVQREVLGKRGVINEQAPVQVIIAGK
jgi:hypothetical protein